MAEPDVEFFRRYELRLLRCTLAAPSSDAPIKSQPPSNLNPSSSHFHSFINDILNSVESGNYLHALSSDAARLVLGSQEFDVVDSSECADSVYSELLGRVEAFIVDGSENDADKACRVILVMCLAIAALFWFTQCNLTG